jgi:hypothetical protein
MRPARLARDAELFGQREHQGARLQVRVRYVCTHPVRRQGRQELAAKEGLAGPDLAGDLDETFAVRHRDEQSVERLLNAAAGEEVTRVRGDAERQLAQAEVLEVVHRSLRPGGGVSAS